MTHRWTWLVVSFGSLVGIGCGYEDYKARLGDSIAKLDWNDKVEASLGPGVTTPDKGLQVRLPKNAGAWIPVDQLPADLTALSDTGNAAGKPLKIACIVSRAGTIEDLIQQAFSFTSREAWMGNGVEMASDTININARTVRIGPALRTARQATVELQFMTVKQNVPLEKGEQQFVWAIFFFDRPEGKAMIAYRVLDSDYSGGLSDTIDLSAGTVSVIGVANPGAAPNADAPAGKRRG